MRGGRFYTCRGSTEHNTLHASSLCAAHWAAVELLLPNLPNGFLSHNPRTAVNLVLSSLHLAGGMSGHSHLAAMPLQEVCRMLGQGLAQLPAVSVPGMLCSGAGRS